MLNFVGLLRSKDFLFPAFETIMYSFVNSADPVLKAYYLQVTYTQYRIIHTCKYYYNLYLSDTDDEEVIVDDQTRNNDIYSARNAESTDHLAYENHT